MTQQALQKTTLEKLNLSPELSQILQQTLSDPDARVALCRDNFVYFCLAYFPHYLSHAFAEFHAEMIDLLEMDEAELLNFIVFRGSGKSSLISTLYVLWVIVYNKRHFIILASDTGDSAQTQMATVIFELQGNALLRHNFGELYKESKTATEISKKKTVSDFVTENDIRVLVRSVGKKVRGERHRQYRPDLAVFDDPETNETATKVTQRNKRERWLKNELMGGMDQQALKLVVVGNWVHNDCLVARLSKDLAWNTMKVPIFEGEKLAWPDRYRMTDEETNRINNEIIIDAHKVISIEGLKRKHGTLVFQQEFLLQSLDPESQIIQAHWPGWQNNISINRLTLRMFVDSASGLKKENDETAILIAGYDPEKKIIYLLDGCSGRYTMSEIVKRVAYYADYYKGETNRPRVEAIAANEYLCQQIEREHRNISVVRVRPLSDKHSRLVGTSVHWERGHVVLNKDCPWMEKVYSQVVYFGKEAHDDCMDVATYAIEDFLMPKKRSKIHMRA